MVLDLDSRRPLRYSQNTPVGRLGYYDYATVDSMFEMTIPGENEALLAGLEGASAIEKKEDG
ncbi:MAG: hypothetical protein R6V25_02815 [Desulfatiglandales bacterium]